MLPIDSAFERGDTAAELFMMTTMFETLARSAAALYPHDSEHGSLVVAEMMDMLYRIIRPLKEQLVLTDSQSTRSSEEYSTNAR